MEPEFFILSCKPCFLSQSLYILDCPQIQRPLYDVAAAHSCSKIARFARILDFLDFFLEEYKRSSCGASMISASGVGVSSLLSLTSVLTDSDTSMGELLQLSDLSDNNLL